MENYDYLIVGGGVIGNTVAMELSQRYAARSIAVIEKEPSVGMHASGRNSGVIHSGFYYSRGGLKSRFCSEGNRELKEYCSRNGIPFKNVGKVVVARNEEEAKVIEEFERNGKRAGIDVRIIDVDELGRIEPSAITTGIALHSPTTAIVDPMEVTRSFKKKAESSGVKYFLDTEMKRLDAEKCVVETGRGSFRFGHLVNSAGLYADRIAHMFGAGKRYKIIPFRGDYYTLGNDKNRMIRGNIYPVPDTRNPFLGVHFTPTMSGDVTVGPTATPVLGRENYNGLEGINPGEMLDILSTEAKLFVSDPSFRTIVRDELKIGRKSNYARECGKIVRDVSESDLIRSGKSGIRAQLFDTKEKRLVSDFVVERGQNSTHVLNAVSPAFTCSLPFSRYIVEAFL